MCGNGNHNACLRINQNPSLLHSVGEGRSVTSASVWSLDCSLCGVCYNLCGVSNTAFVEYRLQPLWSLCYSLCGVATTAFVESLLQPAPSQFSAACCGRQGREGCRGDPWCRLCMIDLHLSSKCESPFPLSGPHPSAFPHHSQSHAHTHTHTHARTHARTHTHTHLHCRLRA